MFYFVTELNLSFNLFNKHYAQQSDKTERKMRHLARFKGSWNRMNIYKIQSLKTAEQTTF